ncbi:MAG: hypothetical protein J2P17_34555, partial [Mycobacterium sp.]|nr:hypothetical protein [Mycobacterium sp.]
MSLWAGFFRDRRIPTRVSLQRLAGDAVDDNRRAEARSHLGAATLSAHGRHGRDRLRIGCRRIAQATRISDAELSRGEKSTQPADPFDRS